MSDNGTNKSTLYDGTGAKQALIVGVAGGPSGTVFNGTGDFKLSNGKASIFLFASEDAGISAWTPGSTTAVFVAGSANGVYKGLAIASMNGKNYLYATNFRSGKMEVWDTNFARVPMSAYAFRLCDEFGNDLQGSLANLVPFNVQNIGGSLVVAFAKQDAVKHDNVNGAGLGAVAAFSPDGRLLKIFQHGPWLNAPWGLALAPSDFGTFSHALLVGQFGSGQVAAYNVMSGEFMGVMEDATGKALSIDGLWGLSFGNGASAGPATTLYYGAGPNGETGGLFGSLTPLAADMTLGNGN